MLSIFLAGSSFGYDERPIVPAEAAVQVRFQLNSMQSNSAWTTGSVSLRGSVSESMMANGISRRYPHKAVRILSADCGKKVQTLVRYQLSRDGKSWSSGTITLTNALTESMARNQLLQKHPQAQVRILGMENR